MSATTYLFNDEYTEPTSDKDINTWLERVCRASGQDWRVQESIYQRTRKFPWIRAQPDLKLYSLYIGTEGRRFTVVHFWQIAGCTCSKSVTAETLLNTLMGILLGVDVTQDKIQQSKVVAFRSAR
jgi:hypothetical protein